MPCGKADRPTRHSSERIVGVRVEDMRAYPPADLHFILELAVTPPGNADMLTIRYDPDNREADRRDQRWADLPADDG
jgi:hypothetical protein